MSQLNPVSRILQAASLSEKAFRDRFEYSKQFMVDVTAGTYTRLSDSIHLSLKQLAEEKGLNVRDLLLDEYNATSLDEAYTFWQTAERRRNRTKFVTVRGDESTPQLSPAHFFVKRTSGTPTRFSKDLKVPPQQVRRWVSGQTKSTPESIELALREIAYPGLVALLSNQERWIEEHA